MPGMVAMDCNGEVAVLRHFWQCQKAKKKWKMIFETTIIDPT